MTYWIASVSLFAFGVVAMLSIGRPFMLVGLTLLVLAPVRRRPLLFWPPLTAVAAWNAAFMAVAPMTCTATQSIGASNAGDEPGELRTVCSSLIGGTYRGVGIYNPSLEPANQAAIAVAIITFVAVCVVVVVSRRARRVGGAA